MESVKNIKIEELDPTFLFTWKGTREQDEENYHNHEFLEMAFVLSGEGNYHIEGEKYVVKEGDLLILNPGVRHQALMSAASELPTTEFFVGFSDIQVPGYPRNFLPVPEGGYIIHTSGELRQKIFRICSSMAALPLFSGRSGISISSNFPNRLRRFRYSSAISR